MRPATATADRFLPFSWVPGIRWALLVVALAVAAARGPVARDVLAWGLVLLAWTAWGTLYQRFSASAAGTLLPCPRTPTAAVVDVALNVAAVATTGYWTSPFVFCLLAAVLGAAATRGFAFGLRASLVAIAAVAVPYQVAGDGSFADRLQISGQWTVELVLVVVLAGYARFLFGQAEASNSQALDRLNQLSEANDLLVSLHRVAQTLPASLNLDQVLTSTLTRLRSLVQYDAGAVLLRDDVTSRWVVRAGDGVPHGRSFSDDELPPALRAATASSVASLVVCLAPGEGLGPGLLARSGVYAPLRARGGLIGLLAIEHREAGHYGRRALRILDGFVAPAALAIDNARWFSRLRTMGADEERVRIARDIHDSVGQSLAYVAFRLDTAIKLADDPELREELDGLRGEVRCVLTDVRDALCDLRTDVSEEHGLPDTLRQFLDRVRSRANLEVTFHDLSTGRLPVLRERELWRIAQEAVSNVEQHANARHLRVRWECDGDRALLQVADDGQGFRATKGGRTDSFGIKGMKERADAIGAQLEIESEPYVGTLVECRVSP